MNGYGNDFPFDAIGKVWKKKYLNAVQNKPVPLKTGALLLLQHLKKEGTRRVVVTSTNKELALRKLTNAEIVHFFDFILGRDEVKQGKPNPEIYLTACRELGEEPADCLAIEDSDNGVLAAHNAGLTVIQVPDLVEPSERVRGLRHKILNSLDDVYQVLGL